MSQPTPGASTTGQPIAVAPVSQARLRSARRLLRRKDRATARLFLAEGRQAVHEALATPSAVEHLVVAADVVDRHQDLVRAAHRAGVAVSSATPSELAELTDTVTPQGIVAVTRWLDQSLEQAFGVDPSLIVLCDRVRDPGNLGTVIRCADAFGADAVLVSTESVDLYNAKTVRATTGSLFHLPISLGVDLEAAVGLARQRGLQVFGADGGGDTSLDELAATGELARPTLWVMGNEAWGLPEADVAVLDRVVGVPMYGRAESLNLSTAAAICLYASASARRAAAS